MPGIRQPLARHRGADPAIVSASGEVSADQLRRRAAGVAAAVQGAARVLVACEDRQSFVVGLLGAWGAGCTAVLPSNFQPAVLDALFDSADICLSDSPRANAVVVSDLEPAANALPQLLPNAVAVELETSGSTGKPRRVAKTFAQLLGEAAVLGEHFGLGEQTRVLSTVPPHHVYGLLFGVLVPLTCGGAVVASAPLHPEAVAAELGRYRATVFVSTPAHLRSLEILDETALRGVQRVFSSGAALHPATAERLRTVHGRSVVEVLGSTETGGIAWREDDGPWTPLPGVVVGQGDTGRLIVERGFAAEHPFVADDLVELVGGSQFHHRGRVDDVVKIAGKRVSLDAIRARLLECDGVEDAAVLSEPDVEGRGGRVRAAVVSTKRNAAELRAALTRWFDPVTVPRIIEFVEQIPRERSGKVQRERLAAALNAGPLRRIEQSNRIPEDSVFFNGHFDGRPIFPGVVELELAIREAARRWPDLGAPVSVQRLKFKQTLHPGDPIELVLVRPERANRVTFELRRRDEVCASGSLVYP